MMADNNNFIQTVKSDEIPWQRLTTAYGRASGFPKYFDVLSKMKDLEAINNAGEEIGINIEHQSTLWHSTPFALIFLGRIFKQALDRRKQDNIADYLANELLELFIGIAEAIKGAEGLEHADQLPYFSDLLKEDYLWSEEYDEDADELRYESDEVFPDDLFYSFYYYSHQVLLLCKPMLLGLDYERAKVLYKLL